ncbi:hypothetical protein AGLY_012719 [Aphis glycines]|uniref:Uncharacterized protein n=1 Tax=Aphis glycines TaxID=307491 RepID=A0A6G0T913_APHGL|nr:hypothetical protein AGLY_012719 [Aphis glycines]
MESLFLETPHLFQYYYASCSSRSTFDGFFWINGSNGRWTLHFIDCTRSCRSSLCFDNLAIEFCSNTESFSTSFSPGPCVGFNGLTGVLMMEVFTRVQASAVTSIGAGMVGHRVRVTVTVRCSSSVIVVVFSTMVLFSSLVLITELVSILFFVSFGVASDTIKGGIVLDTLGCGGDNAIDADLLTGNDRSRLSLDAEVASVTGVITTTDLDLLGGLTAVGDKSDILLVMEGETYSATDADRLIDLIRSSHRPGFVEVGDWLITADLDLLFGGDIIYWDHNVCRRLRNENAIDADLLVGCGFCCSLTFAFTITDLDLLWSPSTNEDDDTFFIDGVEMIHVAIVFNDNGVAVEVRELDLLVVICCLCLLLEVGEVGTVADMDLPVKFVITGMGFLFVDLDALVDMVVGVFTPVVVWDEDVARDRIALLRDMASLTTLDKVIRVEPFVRAQPFQTCPLPHAKFEEVFTVFFNQPMTLDNVTGAFLADFMA